MKKLLIISTMTIGFLALAVGLMLAPKAHAAGPNASQTAQDVMVKTVLDNAAFQISGTTTYTFDKDCAEGNYTAGAGTWDGNTPTCSGSAANCASTNQPAVPTAPDPDAHGPNSIEHHAQQDRCTYYCGGTLSSWNYTQTATVAGLNGKGNWTFTFNYSSSPKIADVAAGTCWSCAETGGTVDVGFSGFVSSESYLNNRNTGTTKYSFTLLDSLGASRVLGATAKLQYSADGLFDDTVDVGTIAFTDPLPVTSTVNDYLYYGNAGVFGNSAVFSQLHAIGGGKPATNVSAILLEDNFANNNNDLTNGNVQEADFSGSFTGLTQAGSYRVVISGTVKDNAGSGFEAFSVTSNSTIIGGCDQCSPPALTCSTPTPTPEPTASQ
jgi:hypothetical protein